jgi:hypothetical protein
VSTYFPKVIDKQVELTDKPGQFRGMFDKMSKKLPGLKKHLDQMPNLKATPSPTKDKTTPVMEI